MPNVCRLRARGRRLAGASLLISVLLCSGGLSAPSAAAEEGEARPVDAAETAPRIVLRGAEVGAPVTPFRVDVDLRDVPPPPQWKPGDPVREIPMRRYPRPGVQPVAEEPLDEDPLVRRQLEHAAAADRGAVDFSTPTRTFAGQGYTGVNPPDTNGDVGPNHYIQTINASGGTDVRIWDKALPTPNELATFRLDTLGSGSCANGLGDPVVLYDREVDRWLLTEFSSAGNNLCVYISQTSDPVSGGWMFYGFSMPSFPDYPKYGIWPTDANGGQGSYVVTANDGGPGAIALDRGAILNGEAASFQRLALPNLSGFSIQAPAPATLDGANPVPANEPAIIMRHRDTEIHNGPPVAGDVLEMWLFDVDWQDPGNTTLVQSSDLNVADFDSTPCGTAFVGCFPQPGSSTSLMPIREALMNRLQYVNHGDFETLVGSYVVDVGSDQGGVRWFELRRTGGAAWTVRQEGTYSIDTDNRWMSSIAMDVSENIAMGYNITSSTTFPSIRYTGRLADDALGLMTQPEGTIHDGTAANSSIRYGDYAAIDVDPVDDCTFWFTGMDNTSSNWRTQVASFVFDSCGCELEPSPLSVSGQLPGDNEIELSWNDADLETVVEYLVFRSRAQGGPYDLVATVDDTSPGIAAGPDTFYADDTVSGGTTYYYVVRASDGETCKSDPSNEVELTATGVCTLAPVFDGLQNVIAPALNNCTLDLVWNDGIEECSGPLTYNVYRSNVAGFTPGAANLVASGVPTTSFSDFDQLVDGTTYFYVVRAVDGSNGVEEGNSVQLSGDPGGPGGAPCTTVSSCPDNPFVDVQPDGFVTACENSDFALNAVPTGGTGDFQYQWTIDGEDIPGATDPFYVPDKLGVHTYNVKVQAETCPGFVFDGLDTDVQLVNTPFFDGVTAVANPQTPECGLELFWNAGTTVCDGPVRYFVYRDTASPVVPGQADLVAAGVLGTSFVDSTALVNGQTYYYLVRAQDASTRRFDGNTAEASAFPDGPGSGPQAVLDEDFEDAGRFSSDWTVTTGPGVHTCGEWAQDTSNGRRPPGSTGTFASANNECNPILGRTSTTMTSRSIDVDLANLVSVTLEYDVWFNHDGNETAKVEVFDGSSWVTLWEDSNIDLVGHQSYDVTAWAAGNPDFKVRFDYQDAIEDKWFSVDNVQVIALIDVQCATAPPGPAGVPDGSLGTAPLRGERLTPAGDAIAVSWDATSCTAADYNLLYGDLADVAAVAVTGSACSLGSAGSFTWNGVPGSSLFFLVVGTDGAGTEGGWGLDGAGGERGAYSASGECATTFKDPSNSCP